MSGPARCDDATPEKRVVVFCGQVTRSTCIVRKRSGERKTGHRIWRETFRTPVERRRGKKSLHVWLERIGIPEQWEKCVRKGEKLSPEGCRLMNGSSEKSGGEFHVTLEGWRSRIWGGGGTLSSHDFFDLLRQIFQRKGFLNKTVSPSIEYLDRLVIDAVSA